MSLVNLQVLLIDGSVVSCLFYRRVYVHVQYGTVYLDGFGSMARDSRVQSLEVQASAGWEGQFSLEYLRLCQFKAP